MKHNDRTASYGADSAEAITFCEVKSGVTVATPSDQWHGPPPAGIDILGLGGRQLPRQLRALQTDG